MRTTMYGRLPVDLGLVDISPKEHLCWLYCPIQLPGTRVVVPPNLAHFEQIIERVRTDIAFLPDDPGLHDEAYIYVTAKTLWVTPDSLGNRPGWHSDGFMTDDLNYIWSDGNPTLFWESREGYAFVQDHARSLVEMEAVCEHDVARHRTYPDKHLLRLDQRVMHRVNDARTAGMRTFVKISVSRNEYRLEGNSINHDLAPNWTYEARREERNALEVR